MYKIIGADKKEYGPVTAEQLRQWIIEGRVNGQTSVWSEVLGEWKPLAAYPEFEDILRPAPSGASTFAAGGNAVAPTEVVLGRDYALDIGNCITRSWALVKQHFWPVVGITFVVILVIGVVNQLLGLLSGPAIRGMIFDKRITVGAVSVVLLTSVLGTPVYVLLVAWLFKYYLKLIRGQFAGIADAFSGFGSASGQLVLLGLTSGVLSTLGYFLCLLPGIYLTVSWMFAVPLVIDRGMGFWNAMEFSRKVVCRHWFLLFALQLVSGLLASCGVIACCIGVFVTIPIGFVTLMYAYEDLFGLQAT